MRAPKNSKELGILALIISVLFHTSALLYKITEEYAESASASPREKVVKVNFKKLPPPKDGKKRKRVLRIKNQIVNSEETKNKTKPKTDRFLGKQNQNFDRQSIAKKIDRFKKAGKGSKEGTKQVRPSNTKLVGEQSQSKKSKKVTKAKKKSTKNIKMADLNIFSNSPKAAQKLKPKKGMQKNLGLQNGERGLSGLAQNNDFIEDVPLGDFTRLNTQEFKFYGFYHRIRQRLEQYWGHKLKKKAEKIYRSGRRIPASENLITSLKIILDSKGSIVNVIIQGSSGVRELDEAAIEAFNNAGPFPNPPRGMIRNGKATIEWGFVVKS